MSKIKTVTKFEVIRQVKKPIFWIFLLLMPLGVFAMIGLSALDSYNTSSNLMDGSKITSKTIGYTNESNLYANFENDLTKSFSAGDATPKIVNVSSVEDGKSEVVAGNLDIYYHLPANLVESLTINVYYRAAAGTLVTDYATPVMNALKAQAIDKLGIEDKLVISGALKFQNTALDNNGKVKNMLGEAIIPIVIGVIFYILICVFGSRLVAALTEEKENRISEMILTSVSARDLVIGKIISLIILGFIQMIVFIIPAVAALIIYRDNPMVAEVISQISVNPWTLILSILLLIASYFFFVASSTLVSSMVPTARDANNFFGIVMIGLMAPLFLISGFFAETPGAAVYFLSYFPMTAPISLIIRNVVGNISTPEMVIGIADLAVCSAVVIRWTVKSFQKNAINFAVSKPKFGIRKSWKR